MGLHFSRLGLGETVKRVLLVFVLLTLSFSVVAQESISTNERALLNTSGAYAPFDDLDQHFKAGVKEGAKGKSSDVLNRLLQLSDKHLNKQNLISKFDAEFVGKVSQVDVNNSLQWYKSDLGSRINAAELAVSGSVQQEAMMAEAGELMKNTKRVEIEQSIVEAFGVSDMLGDMQIQITFALMDALAKSYKHVSLDALEPVKNQLLNNAPAVKSQIDQTMLIILLYAHKDFSMEELRQYEDFVKSQSGRAYHDAASEAVVNAINNAIVDLTSEI